MDDAKRYQKDFDRLMAPFEAKADRVANENANEFIKSLIARGKAVGISLSDIVERVEKDNGFAGIRSEISAREKRRQKSS